LFRVSVAPIPAKLVPSVVRLAIPAEESHHHRPLSTQLLVCSTKRAMHVDWSCRPSPSICSGIFSSPPESCLDSTNGGACCPCRYYGLQPELDTYKSIIKACLVAKEFNMALTTLFDIQKSGRRPDQETWDMLVEICAECGKWDAALEIIREILAEEVGVLDDFCFLRVSRLLLLCRRCCRCCWCRWWWLDSSSSLVALFPSPSHQDTKKLY